jgi:hypothetical protein
MPSSVPVFALEGLGGAADMVSVLVLVVVLLRSKDGRSESGCRSENGAGEPGGNANGDDAKVAVEEEEYWIADDDEGDEGDEGRLPLRGRGFCSALRTRGGLCVIGGS